MLPVLVHHAGALPRIFPLLLFAPVALRAQPPSIVPVQIPAWAQISPAGGPPAARFGASAVFDAATSQMIVFGGSGSGLGFNDLWTVDPFGSRHWTLLGTAGAMPPPLANHSAVYHDGVSRMIVFGGRTNAGPTCSNDLWILANANRAGGAPTWTKLVPAGPLPPPRAAHTAVYDPATNRMIVFGGDNCNGGILNDLWILSNADGAGGAPSWTQITAAGPPPPPRLGATAVFDPAWNRMVLFGGVAPMSLNDVWVLTGATGPTPAWMPAPIVGPAIPPRAFHTAVYSPAANTMTVFGGSDGPNSFNEVWLLLNASGVGGPSSWTQALPSGAGAPPRSSHAAVFAGSGRIAVFGGLLYSFGPLNDTWILTNGDLPVPPLPRAVSANPAWGSGSNQLFEFRFTDPIGAADLQSVTIAFTSEISSTACRLTYDRVANVVTLSGDSSSPASVSVAIGGVVANSACSINVAPTAVTTSGPDLTLTLPVTFKAAFGGVQQIVGQANGSVGATTAQLGTWLSGPVPLLYAFAFEPTPVFPTAEVYSYSAQSPTPPASGTFPVIARGPVSGIVNGSRGADGKWTFAPPSPGPAPILSDVAATDLSFSNAPGFYPSAPATRTLEVSSPGTVDITITDPMPPQLTSVAPNSAPIGMNPFTVSAAGSNFAPGASLRWTPPGGITTTLPASFVSAAQVQASIPPSLMTSPGVAQVAILNPGSVPSNPVSFFVVGLPILTALNPNTAPVNSGPLVLSVIGSNFVQGASILWIPQSGTSTPLPATFVNSTLLQATVPPGLLSSAGIAQVAVLNSGAPPSPPLPFYIAGPPQLTSISPNIASVTSAPVFMIVSGSGFVPGASIQWTPPTGPPTSIPASLVSAAQLQATIPASLLTTTGTALVAVLNPGNQLSPPQQFSIIGPPQLASINPAAAPLNSGPVTLTATGSNFIPGAMLRWMPPGGLLTTLAPAFISSTQLQATVPASLLTTPGVAQVSVLNPGNVPSNSQAFTVTGCVFSLNFPTLLLPSGSGTFASVLGSFGVRATNCTAADTWTVRSNSPLLKITSLPGGNGATGFTSVNYLFLTNTTTLQRTATFTISGISSGQPFTLNGAVAQLGSTEPQLARVVRALYQTILGREPDAGGFQFWTGPGAPHDSTGATLLNQMADGFYTSAEFRATGWEVLSIYQAVLGRQPLIEEWQSWAELLRSGAPVFLLVNTLTASPEYQARAGGPVSNTNFVQQAIQNGWGRPATLAELNAYSTQLNNSISASPRTDFLNGVILPDPAFQNGTNAQWVTMLYLTILVRTPDPDGLSFWLQMATASPGQGGVYYLPPSSSAAYAIKLAIIGQAAPPNPDLLGFLGSPEFQALIR